MIHEILLDNSSDPDISFFFYTDIQNVDTAAHILPEELESFPCKLNSKCLSIFYMNIRSLKKNFDSFKLFLSSLNFEFSMMFF